MYTQVATVLMMNAHDEHVQRGVSSRHAFREQRMENTPMSALAGTHVTSHGLAGTLFFHRPNAMMAAADDPKSEGLSSRVNFVASSGTSKTTTHCSGGPCSADSAHVCFFLVLGLDARINHPGVFIVGVRLLVSSSISAIHCCPHLSKLRLWKSC